MPRVRYAVAGVPIGHSLSPLLMGLVCEHLRVYSELIPTQREKGVKPLPRTSIIKIDRLDLVPVDKVEDALAWGYVGMYPGDLPNWDLVNSPLPAFRGKTLLERACVAAIEEVSGALASPYSANPLNVVADSNMEMSLDGGGPLPPLASKKIPGNHLENWLSLTSPLKHQLSSAAIHYADDSKGIDSINALLWNKREWWVASTDGAGLVMVAEHFGISIAEGKGAILELHGGGGAARSCAAAWVASRGRIRWTGGRRELADDGPWAVGMVDEKTFGELGPAAVCINFDVNSGESAEGKIINEGGSNKGDSTGETSHAGIHINSAYSGMTGDVESRLAQINGKAGTSNAGGEDVTPVSGETLYLDGRWLLCAQHLAAWSMLWAPKIRQYLPSLGLLISRLAHAEQYLEKY